MKRHILFDLDGTLIDSASSVIETLETTLKAKGIEPVSPLDRGIIGPPLREVLERLIGADDAALTQELTEDFIKCYDTRGYKRSLPYDGIDDMLVELSTMNCDLYIVTNKRIVPTRLIVEHLGWSRFFKDRVYSADAFQPRLDSKAQCIERVLDVHRIAKPDAIYIGDRAEDQDAAESCSLDFLPVNWGYGNWSDSRQGTSLPTKPSDCASMLIRSVN